MSYPHLKNSNRGWYQLKGLVGVGHVERPEVEPSASGSLIRRSISTPASPITASDQWNNKNVECKSRSAIKRIRSGVVNWFCGMGGVLPWFEKEGERIFIAIIRKIMKFGRLPCETETHQCWPSVLWMKLNTCINCRFWHHWKQRSHWRLSRHL
jgi:hypothetical protein